MNGAPMREINIAIAKEWNVDPSDTMAARPFARMAAKEDTATAMEEDEDPLTESGETDDEVEPETEDARKDSEQAKEKGPLKVPAPTAVLSPAKRKSPPVVTPEKGRGEKSMGSSRKKARNV